MRTSAVVAMLALFAVPAVAEDKPISLDLVDVPLAKAAAFVAEAAGIEVTVAEGLPAMPLTLRVKDLAVEKCLEMLALLAGDGVECAKEAEGRYVFRKKLPEWRSRLEATLDACKVDIEYADTPLSEALGFLATFSDVTILLDPGQAATDEGQVSLKAAALPVRKALDLIAGLKGLAFDLRWGAVFVATGDRLKQVPVDLLPAGTPGAKPPAALSKKLDASFEGSTVFDVLEFVRNTVELNIVYADQVASKCAQATAVSCQASGLTVEQFLSAILLPRGFRAAVKDGVLVVSRP